MLVRADECKNFFISWSCKGGWLPEVGNARESQPWPVLKYAKTLGFFRIACLCRVESSVPVRIFLGVRCGRGALVIGQSPGIGVVSVFEVNQNSIWPQFKDRPNVRGLLEFWKIFAQAQSSYLEISRTHSSLFEDIPD